MYSYACPMFLKYYAQLANDYKICKHKLELSVERIEWYQKIEYKKRLKHTYYNRLVIRADRLVGDILELEEKMQKAYIEFNS